MSDPTALPASTRKKIETALDRLIAALDALDPDPDLEEGDPGGGDVVDEPHDDFEQGDREPSLGSLDRENQLGWAGGGGCCDGEPDYRSSADIAAARAQASDVIADPYEAVQETKRKLRKIIARKTKKARTPGQVTFFEEPQIIAGVEVVGRID